MSVSESRDPLLPRDAMLARYKASCHRVCPSVTVPKWLNVGSRKQRHTIAQKVFWRRKSRPNYNGVIPYGAPNRGGVGLNWRFSTNISLQAISETCKIRLTEFAQKTLSNALSNGAIFSDLEWLLTTSDHPIFDILYRLSYLRSG